MALRKACQADLQPNHYMQAGPDLEAVQTTNLSATPLMNELCDI